jgi:hypothetical protein
MWAGVDLLGLVAEGAGSGRARASLDALRWALVSGLGDGGDEEEEVEGMGRLSRGAGRPSSRVALLCGGMSGECVLRMGVLMGRVGRVC